VTNRIDSAIEYSYKYETIFYIAGALFILSVFLIRLGVDALILIIATLCISILVNQYLHYLKKKNFEDERTRVIYAHAALNTIYTTILAIVGFWILTGSHLIPDISTLDVLATVVFLISMPFLGWIIYYKLKGHVDL
jgi:hypothetical protein